MALTEFKHMKKLPAVIGNMSSLVNLTIRNCDLEELPDELRFTNIVTLHIENTQLAQLPEAVADMKQLINVYLLNNQFTTFPEILTKNENIYHFIMVNEKINEVPASIKNWKYLANFMITGSNISTLPDVFNDVYHMSVLDFSNNKNLSTLPPSLLDTKVAYEGGGYTEKSIRGIILDGCSFTEIPASIIRPGIKMLSMKDNKIAELRKEDLEKMCDLNTLVLDRNPLTAFPQITHNQLGYLSLIGCGLKESDIDVTGMTNLSANHFFLTQEKYNEIMLPSINTDGTWN
jgi:Leucine-rich repeat (LRR) protein